MGGGLSGSNPTIVDAFHRALLHQGVIVFALLAVVAISWNVIRGRQLARAGSSEGTRLDAGSPDAGSPDAGSPDVGSLDAGSPDVGSLDAGSPDAGSPVNRVAGRARTAVVTTEPAARRLLRVSFGLIWLFDGLLQMQASMPAGMIGGVVQPSESASPRWVQDIVNAGTNVWSYHPVTAAAAAVWIQVGIGLWLLVAPRGSWSRLAGVSSAAWGIAVWVFGESFGAIFAPGPSWLFGLPGAVLFYVAAGVLVALPSEVWSTPRIGRIILRVMGLYFVGTAILQAWPGRGFWQGQVAKSGPAGSLTSMLQQMAGTPQPHWLSSAVSSFAGFDASHGWGVNLFFVVVLTGIGATLMVARPKVTRYGVWAAGVICLAVWIFIQDLGFMGGVGTDPNSMIPMLLLIISGQVAITRVPVRAEAPAAAAVASESRGWREVVALDPAFALRTVAALAAFGIVLIGAIPMAVATTRSHADTIIDTTINGPVSYLDSAAPPFNLTDQGGRQVSLASLQGKAVAITFLDPVCTSDCPIIAREFADTDPLLGSASSHVELIAVDANPTYLANAYLTAFDRQERLDTVPNWLYLTGSLRSLEAVWRSYGVEVDAEPGGAMVLHSEVAYVIGPTGRFRAEVDTDPGPGTSASSSSFSVTLADTLKKALRGS